MSTASPQTPPLPETRDPDTGGHFEAAARGELAIRMCRSCGETLHLPLTICTACHGADTEWRTVAPRGTVYSFTAVERQVHPAFPAPYAVILVQLDDLPKARLVGHLPGRPDIRIGMAVEGHFEQVGDATLLRWRPAADHGQ